jgi:oxygen-independent coproporphyrinogen-3 oxidase
LIKELLFYEGIKFETLYVGGGTPSIINKVDCERLFKKIGEICDLGSCIEYTVELNPESASAEKLDIWLENGVNRFSVGVQSFSDRVLAAMNRSGRQGDIVSVIGALKDRGIKNFNIDLILGIQDKGTFITDLKMAAGLQPPHLSIYFLGIADDRPLSEMIRLNKFKIMCDEEYEELYLYIGDFLSGHGYQRYEISNYAKSGYRSAHNLNYWEGGDYIGAGLSAVSTVGSWRMRNVRDLKQYFRMVENGEKPVADIERITTKKRCQEKIMLGLRTSKGLELRELFDIAADYEYKELASFIDLLEENCYGEATSTHFVLSPKGFLRSNSIIAELWKILEH